MAQRMLAADLNSQILIVDRDVAAVERLRQKPGQAGFNRMQLLAQVWGGDNEVDERTVDVNVQRLRNILAQPGSESYIQTVRGFGYRFAAPAASGAMSPASHF